MTPFGKRLKRPKPGRKPADVPFNLSDLTPLTADAVLEASTGGETVLDARIDNLDFSGRKLRGLACESSIFHGTSFAGCEIPSLRLRDVRFVQCDLSNAVLRGCEATRVEFIHCRLTGMIAVECRWQDVLLEDCEGRYIQLSDGRLRSCELKSSNFPEADLRAVDLEGTVFSQVNLCRTDLSRAKLQGIDLRSCEIEGIIIGASDVRGAIVSSAQALDLARLLGLVIE